MYVRVCMCMYVYVYVCFEHVCAVPSCIIARFQRNQLESAIRVARESEFDGPARVRAVSLLAGAKHRMRSASVSHKQV